MSGRDVVFASIRRSLGVSGGEATRRKEAADRVAGHPAGIVPARGQGDPGAQLALFIRMARAASASVETVNSPEDIPARIAEFLRAHNLPMAVRRGDDAFLAGLAWESAGTLEVTTGPSDGHQLASVSHAVAGVAETGTLILVSGRDNPTTLNFLPDNHIVVLDRADVTGDYESVWRRLRDRFGAGVLPRVVNMITGPSRSADIEQTLLLGAHGPRRLHIVILDRPAPSEAPNGSS